MKSFNIGAFLLGFILILISLYFLSSYDNADRINLNNSYKIYGTISDISKTHSKGGRRQNGWKLRLKEIDFEIRIIGNYYSALDHRKFDALVQPGTHLEIFLLKSKYYTFVDQLNSEGGMKNALHINYEDITILDIKDVKEELKGIFYGSLFCGSILGICGIWFIVLSIKTTTNNV